jgi:hypothetical protein
MHDIQDTESVIVLVLLATVLLRFLLVAIVIWLVFPRRRTCPQCNEGTVPILESTYLRFIMMERRWCMSCGWTGIARKTKEKGTGSRTAPTIPPAVLMAAVLCSSTACQPQPDRVAQLFSNGASWVDLSHSFDEKTIYWPTAEPIVAAIPPK